MVDRSDLLLFVETQPDQQQQQPQLSSQQQSSAPATVQTSGQQGRRLLSLQETFELMVGG